MLKDDVIKKALLHKQIYDSNSFSIEINTNKTIIVNLYRIMLHLLSNFVITYSLTKSETDMFLRKKLDDIIDIVTTEVEIVLLQFANIYKEETTNIIELHNKDECFIVLAVQNEVNKKLKKIM